MNSTSRAAEQRCADLLICSAWSAELADRFEQLGQARRIRKVRGAWRRPALTGSAAQLNRALLASYWRLAHDAIDTLRGSRRRQADDLEGEPISEDEESAALAFFEVPEVERGTPVNRERLLAILLLLPLWRRRHESIATEAVQATFHVGYAQVLKQLGLTSAHSAPDTLALPLEVVERYRGDLDRLERGLRDGTVRSPGLRAIMEEVATVGAAAALVRRLFDEESFRVQMLSEHSVWTSWLQGFRAAAVDGNRELGRLGRPLRRFEWRGPLDGRTCIPCRNQFGPPIAAVSLSDIPLPSTICEWRDGCRHWFALVD